MSRMKNPVLCERMIWDGQLPSPIPGDDSAGGWDYCALSRGHWEQCRTQHRIDKDNEARKNRADNRPNSTRPKNHAL